MYSYIFNAVLTDMLQGILGMFWLLNKYKSLPIKGKNEVILEKQLQYNFKDN